MTFVFAVLAVLVYMGSAQAQGDTEKTQPRAYFPRDGWAYVGTSPDAPSLRMVFVLPAKAMCDAARTKTQHGPTPGVRMSYTPCEPVALGQRMDEAWWVFPAMSMTEPVVTTWAGATEQAMCEQVRGTYASTGKDLRVGRTCQPANLNLSAAAPRVAQPAHSVVATPQFPAQGWGYVQSSPDVPTARFLSLYLSKGVCEAALHQDRQTSRQTHVSYTDCRPVTHGGGIDSGDWWLHHVVTPNRPMTFWMGSTEQAICVELRRSMADPSDPYATQLQLGSCQRVMLRMN